MKGLFPGRCWGTGERFIFGEVFRAPQFTMFDYGVCRCTDLVVFRFVPVHPEFLSSTVVKCLVTNGSSSTRLTPEVYV